MLYEQRFGDKLPDALRRSVYQTKVSPSNLQEHLLLNADKFPDAVNVAEEIERYCDAKEEHEQAMGTPAAGFIGAVDKRPRESGGKGEDSENKKDYRSKGQDNNGEKGYEKRQ